MVVCAALLVGAPAHAQPEVKSSAQSGGPSAALYDRGELWQLRARYGVAVRSGSQTDTGPGLTYSGVTPLDLQLAGWLWYRYVGAHASYHREGFSLVDEQKLTRTQGSLNRLTLAVTGRFGIGPLRLEPMVGYSLNTLPAFGSSVDPQFTSVTRHGLLLAARVLVDIGPVTLEASGGYPLALAAQDAGGKASATGFFVGGGVRAQLFNTGNAHWGLLADAQLIRDSVTSSAGARSEQQIIRAGGAVDLKWQEPRRGPRFGGLDISVLDAADGAPIAAAAIALEGVEGAGAPVYDASGVAHFRELPRGPVVAKVSAGGYLPAEERAEVVLGVDAPVVLRLQREPPRFGDLVVTVRPLEPPGAVLAGATVSLGAATAVTDAKGQARFAQQSPGPAALKVSLAGFKNGEEAANVAAGKTAEVEVRLVPEKKRVLATINGLVRSAKGGAPVAAQLEVPQVKLKTRASGQGAFTFRLEGGTYTVKISAPGFLTQSKDVTVKDGDQAIFNVDLFPK